MSSNGSTESGLVEVEGEQLGSEGAAHIQAQAMGEEGVEKLVEMALSTKPIAEDQMGHSPEATEAEREEAERAEASVEAEGAAEARTQGT